MGIVMNAETATVNKPRAMPIDRGAGWLLEGFGYFSRSALAWIGVMILLFIIRLGLIYLLCVIAITIVALIMIFFMLGGLVFLENMQSGNPDLILQNFNRVLLVLLVALTLYLPLLMAYWFAPALVVLNDVSPIDALIMSFKGCLTNVLPFTLYGIVGLLLTVIAIIPLGLGLLILGPMIVASVYVAWSEIFNTK